MLKNFGQDDRPRILGCEPVDGVLVVLSSNQLNIAAIVIKGFNRTDSIHVINLLISGLFTVNTMWIN